MKKLAVLFLLSLTLASCKKESDDDLFVETKCDCVAVQTTLNGKEFVAQFWTSNDCSKNGDTVLYQNIEHKVRCTQK